eukprot:9696617-Heterocapsa_arctica.AAC.1
MHPSIRAALLPPDRRGRCGVRACGRATLADCRAEGSPTSGAPPGIPSMHGRACNAASRSGRG